MNNMNNLNLFSRRKFINISIQLGVSAASIFTFLTLTSCGGEQKQAEKSQENMAENKNQGKLGIALVGLGNYSTDQLAPALQ